MSTALTSFMSGVRVHLPNAPTPLIEYYLREAAREFCKETLIWQAWCDYIALAVNTRSYALTPPSDSLIIRAMYGKVKHTASNGVITAATQADPVVITSVEHGLNEGAKAYIESVAGMTEINSLTHSVGTVTDDTFELNGVDGSGYSAYTSGGTWNSVSAYTDLNPKTEGVMDTEDTDWRISGQGVTHYFYLPDTENVALSWDPAEAVPNGLRIRAALQPTVTAASVPDVLFNDWHVAIESGTIARLMALPGRPWTDLKSAAVFFSEFTTGKREALGDRMAGNTHRASTVQGSIKAYT